MDSNIRSGFFFSFIVSGMPTMIIGAYSLHEATIYVGIALLVIALIWYLLFLCPISPVKRYTWLITDKLMFTVTKEIGYSPSIRGDLITVWVDLTARSSIMVDKIALKIGSKRIYSFEWEASMILAHKHEFLNFKKPDWLKIRKYKAELFAYTSEGYSKSDSFVIEVDSLKCQKEK